MFSTNKFFRALSVLCLVLTVSVFAFADTVRLKNGSIFKGKIVSFGGGKFVLLISDGTRQRQMTFTADEVESITFDSETTMPSVVNTSNPNYTSENKPTNSTTTTNNTTVKTSAPNNIPSESVKKSVPPQSTNNNSTTAVKPIQLNVKVLADNTANGWTNSGWVVRKGQRIRIAGSGRVSLGEGRYSTPGGISTLPDNEKLMPAQPTGSLIAVIGDDNNDFIFVGEQLDFVAPRDGALFLGVNEGNLNDNSGAFNVTVEIDPTME